MSVVINVFCRNNPVDTVIIQSLLNHGFTHYVDSVRYKDTNWLNTNAQNYEIPNNNKELGFIYTLTFDGSVFLNARRFDKEIDNFLDDDQKVYILASKEEYDFSCFFYDLGRGIEDNQVEDYLKLFGMKKQTLGKLKKEKRGIEETLQEDPSGYTFEFKLVDDVCYYKLTKPNTDLPYIVSTDNFSVHGHKRLFSSMFLFPSWGSITESGVAYPKDVLFLKQVWKHFSLEPEPNFEKLLEAHIEACANGEKEPRVWRAQLEDVIKRNKK